MRWKEGRKRERQSENKTISPHKSLKEAILAPSITYRGLSVRDTLILGFRV